MASGIMTIVLAGGSGLVVVFVLWRRLASVVAFVLLAVCGMGIAAGGLLVQDQVGPASWAVALAALAVLTPLHARLLFGPPGPPRMVAAGPGAA